MKELFEDVVTRSPSSGTTRLVELIMADQVHGERVMEGFPPQVWLSQNTIAERCNCSRSTVERALEKLKELGRIKDTGERKGGLYRGTVVYEFTTLPPDLDATQDRSAEPTDLTDSEVTQSDSRQSDVTDPARDLTQSADDLTDSAARPASWVTHNPGVDPGGNPEDESGAPPAPPLGEPEAIDGELIEGWPDGDTDAARVAEQRESDSTRAYLAAGGALSPFATGAGDTDAQRAALAAEVYREIAEVEQLLTARPEDKLLRGRLDELTAERSRLAGAPIGAAA